MECVLFGITTSIYPCVVMNTADWSAFLCKMYFCAISSTRYHIHYHFHSCYSLCVTFLSSFVPCDSFYTSSTCPVDCSVPLRTGFYFSLLLALVITFSNVNCHPAVLQLWKTPRSRGAPGSVCWSMFFQIWRSACWQWEHKGRKMTWNWNYYIQTSVPCIFTVSVETWQQKAEDLRPWTQTGLYQGVPPQSRWPQDDNRDVVEDSFPNVPKNPTVEYQTLGDSAGQWP